MILCLCSHVYHYRKLLLMLPRVRQHLLSQRVGSLLWRWRLKHQLLKNHPNQLRRHQRTTHLLRRHLKMKLPLKRHQKTKHPLKRHQKTKHPLKRHQRTKLLQQLKVQCILLYLTVFILSPCCR